jgi:MoaA/NifB/PqqE/SkfB family radical SAM enzyme
MIAPTEIPLLARMAVHSLTGLSWRSLPPLLYRYIFQGWRGLRAAKTRENRGAWYPPFLMISLTDRCNLRCKGCWIKQDAGRDLDPTDVQRLIDAGKKRGNHYITLLGGEPLLYPAFWQVIDNNPNCYFQVITNATGIDTTWAKRCSRAGNITPLLSLDGLQQANDQRRGKGVYQQVIDAAQRLRRHKVFFGVATTVTGMNLDQVLCDDYVRLIRQLGAHYLWFYGYRPMGPMHRPEFSLSREQMISLRQRLQQLRQRHPLLLIDTYWNEDGQAVCPAAQGLCAHIGPGGSVEACPPLSYADRQINGEADPAAAVRDSRFVHGFRQLAAKRTRGCLIIEDPKAINRLAAYTHASDTSCRNYRQELDRLRPCCSHHIPGAEIPERGMYRLFKKNLFFGMGAYA